MLIQLDDSICEGLATLSDEEWDALRNLAVAVKEGLHYLVVPRVLSALLSRDERLGLRERVIYREMNDRHSTNAVMAKNVITSVRLIRGVVPERIKISGRTEIRMPLAFFSMSKSSQATILLAENLSDCKLLRELTRAFVKSEGLGSARICFDDCLGGGATTSVLAEDIIKENRRLMFSVVDSDRQTPFGSLGSTALTIQRVYNSLLPVNADLHILRCRELENLMPDDFYVDEFGSHSDHKLSVDFLLSLLGSGCDNARLHVDIKRGLLLKDVFMSPGMPSDFEAVWGPLAQAVADGRLPVSAGCRDCAIAEKCAKPAECSCVLMRSNGANLLERGRTVWERRSRELWNNLPYCLKQALAELCRSLFDWGCAAPKQSVRR